MSTELSRRALTGTVIDPPRAITIFGRDPAFWPGIIEGLLAVLVAFALGVTNESAGLISAFISVLVGAYTAWATQDTSLAWATGVAKAALALFVYYGVHLSAEQISTVVLFAPILIGAWQRTQTSPVAAPTDPSPQQVVPVSPPAGVDTDPQTTAALAAGHARYGDDPKVDAALHDPDGL